MLKDLPDRINSTLNQIEKGELEINMKHEGLNELKNQMSASLIIAALIIGSSLTILADNVSLQSAQRTPFTLFAEIEIPIPVVQITIPFSHSPLATASAAALPNSG